MSLLNRTFLPGPRAEQTDGKEYQALFFMAIELDMRCVAWNESHMGWPAVDTSSCRLPWEGICCTLGQSCLCRRGGSKVGLG